MLVTDAYFVKETTTTTGSMAPSGAPVLTLAGAESGFESFANALAVGDEVIATLRHNLAWMIFRGRLTGATALRVDQIIDSSDSGNPLVLGAGTKQVYIAQLPVSTRALENPIINGGMDIWQRGTSFVSVAAAAYTADRWQYDKVGAMVHDISRSTDVPTLAQAGRLFNYSLLIDCQTVDSSIAAGDYALIMQKIEGYNYLPLAQRPMLLNFWVKATKTGVYCVGLSNSISDRSYIAEYTVGAADTWEEKFIPVPASPSAGTWDYGSGIGLYVKFPLVCGSTFQTTAGSWQTGNFLGTSSQVNAADNIANNNRIVGVRLLPGAVPLPHAWRSFQEELALSQRYYFKTFPYTTAPAQNAGRTGAVEWGQAAAASSHDACTFVQFPVAMRAAPTVTLYNPSAANAQIRSATFNADCSSSVSAAVSEHGTGFDCTTAGGTSAGGTLSVHFQAVAEL